MMQSSAIALTLVSLMIVLTSSVHGQVLLACPAGQVAQGVTASSKTSKCFTPPSLGSCVAQNATVDANQSQIQLQCTQAAQGSVNLLQRVEVGTGHNTAWQAYTCCTVPVSVTVKLIINPVSSTLPEFTLLGASCDSNQGLAGVNTNLATLQGVTKDNVQTTSFEANLECMAYENGNSNTVTTLPPSTPAKTSDATNNRVCVTLLMLTVVGSFISALF